MLHHVLNACKGLAMGMAEVVPGVSGGTIAFITGIYERLMDAIKNIDLVFIRLLGQGRFADALRRIDFVFLLSLGTGMAAGIVTGVLFISYLLETYPLMLWGFFFGLIVASCLYVIRQVSRWKLQSTVALLVGTALSFAVTVLNPGSGNEALWFVFISGAIAISALILPGLSGSFILLLLGMYTFILPTAKSVITDGNVQALTVLAVFCLGCLTGLFSFARVISWSFKHFKNATLTFLTGLMIGSLNKIWPWQQVLSTRINSKGEEVILQSKSVWPGTFAGLENNFAYSADPQVPVVMVCMVAGFLLVFAMDRRLGSKKEG